MADRRMLTRRVTDNDHFLNLSASAQALYLHLSMSADDDGFCGQVTVSMFRAHASVSDLESLLAEGFVFQFESGVIVIRHWRAANTLRKDRYSPTVFQKEMSMLSLEKDGVYAMRNEAGCQTVAGWLPDGCRRLGKDKLIKDIDLSSLRSERFVGDDAPTEGEPCFGGSESPVIMLQINTTSRTGETYPVFQSDIDHWSELYQSVDVLQELRKAAGWLEGNPTRRKTKRGMPRFITNWLSHAQDRGGVKTRAVATPTEYGDPEDFYK